MRNLILHNPRCAKSRETLQLLKDRGIELEVVEYLQHPPTKAELRDLCKLLGSRPLEIVRTKEVLFGELGLSAGNGYSDEQWLEVLAKNPKLIERPIVVYRGKAALGRPPEAVAKIL